MLHTYTLHSTTHHTAHPLWQGRITHILRKLALWAIWTEPAPVVDTHHPLRVSVPAHRTCTCEQSATLVLHPDPVRQPPFYYHRKQK